MLYFQLESCVVFDVRLSIQSGNDKTNKKNNTLTNTSPSSRRVSAMTRQRGTVNAAESPRPFGVTRLVPPHVTPPAAPTTQTHRRENRVQGEASINHQPRFMGRVHPPAAVKMCFKFILHLYCPPPHLLLMVISPFDNNKSSILCRSRYATVTWQLVVVTLEPV